MAAPAGPKSGRKPFRGMAPKAYRLRMMEPGEAVALLAIRHACEMPAAHRLDVADFVRLLLAHEVYVAVAKRDEHAVGYAIAGSQGPVYWLVELHVAPCHRGRGVGTALLDSVTLRARWFDHRALAVSCTVEHRGNEPFYRDQRFTPTSPAELPLGREDGPGPEIPVPGGTVMVKWL